MIILALLPLITSQSSGEQRIGPRQVESLRRLPKLDLEQAYTLLEVELSGQPYGVTVSERTRLSLEGVINRVAWPSAFDESGFGGFIDDAPNRIDPALYHGKATNAAVGLILAAWDAHIGRVQVINWSALIGCPRIHVHLERGTMSHGPILADGYTSPEWPWRKNGSRRLILQPFGLGLVAGNVAGGPLDSMIEGWRNEHRELLTRQKQQPAKR